MAAGSCSTTTTVLPPSASRRNRPSNRPVSAGCRPMVGSSSTYRVSTRCEPRALESARSEEHTSELQSRLHLVCRLLLEKKKKTKQAQVPTLLLPYIGPLTQSTSRAK